MNTKTDAKSTQPRRTTTKEASERNAPVVKEHQENVNVLAVLADPHPRNGEDYALHLFYRSNHFNPNFQCTHKSIENDNETAHLTINNIRYEVNIRTGIIKNLGEV